MSKIVQFGENVAGYNIPVLNEREIRVGAGIMFLATFIALMRIIYEENFLFIKFIIIVFVLDFFIRLFINPKFAPLLIVTELGKYHLNISPKTFVFLIFYF
ncbi:MAG: hypothetical protein SFU27_12765 [Thermonemataceae bacterium]|nr:hypothetical protein [Thermonemataceae bacterium]